MIYRCGKCKSTNIQVKAWISANTNQIHDWVEDNRCWCENCSQITKYEGVE